MTKTEALFQVTHTAAPRGEDPMGSGQSVKPTQGPQKASAQLQLCSVQLCASPRHKNVFVSWLKLDAVSGT